MVPHKEINQGKILRVRLILGGLPYYRLSGGTNLFFPCICCRQYEGHKIPQESQDRWVKVNFVVALSKSEGRKTGKIHEIQMGIGRVRVYFPPSPKSNSSLLSSEKQQSQPSLLCLTGPLE